MEPTRNTWPRLCIRFRSSCRSRWETAAVTRALRELKNEVTPPRTPTRYALQFLCLPSPFLHPEIRAESRERRTKAREREEKNKREFIFIFLYTKVVAVVSTVNVASTALIEGRRRNKERLAGRSKSAVSFENRAWTEGGYFLALSLLHNVSSREEL